LTFLQLLISTSSTSLDVYSTMFFMGIMLYLH